MRITIVAGARPNFMKIAPIIHEMERLKAKAERLKYRLVHIGHHAGLREGADGSSL